MLNSAAAHLKELEDMKAKNQEKDSKALKLRRKDGTSEPLGYWLRRLIGYMLQTEEKRLAAAADGAPRSSKFFGQQDNGIKALTVGKPEAAALGLMSCLHVPRDEIYGRLRAKRLPTHP